MDHSDALRTDRPGEHLVGNTIPGTVTKLLTLVPILVAIYFFDFSKFYTLIISDGEGAFFAVTVSLFLLGVVLKRRILRTRLELSKISFIWGLLFLGVALCSMSTVPTRRIAPGTTTSRSSS